MAAKEQPRIFRIEGPQAAKGAVPAPVVALFSGPGCLSEAIFRCCRVDLRYGSNELIAPARDGLNEAVAVSVVPKNLAQNVDVLRQVVLIHKAFRPKTLKQLLLGYHSGTVLHQKH